MADIDALKKQEAEALAKLAKVKAKLRSAKASEREAKRKDDNRAKLLAGVVLQRMLATVPHQAARILRRDMQATLQQMLADEKGRKDAEWLMKSEWWLKLCPPEPQK